MLLWRGHFELRSKTKNKKILLNRIENMTFKIKNSGEELREKIVSSIKIWISGLKYQVLRNISKNKAKQRWISKGNGSLFYDLKPMELQKEEKEQISNLFLPLKLPHFKTQIFSNSWIYKNIGEISQVSSSYDEIV